MSKRVSKSTGAGPETVRRVLQRFVLPADRDLDVVPLYVDTEGVMLDADKEMIGTNKSAQKVNKAASRQAISSGTALHQDTRLDRRRLRVESTKRISFGTYC
jgi:galactofuranosylgalactofuranosylrhamnosyl-N-acetylglucosaminyl-diphospho-decaprenol beta-1,5/1,6-galactofuranosyltransferase